MALVSPLLPPKQVPLNLPQVSGVQYKFREESERATLAGKAVRVASGIRVAFMLADLGHIAECGTILRTVSDFSTEIISICEGCSRGAPTSAQKKFVEQYFKPLPSDPDEYEHAEKERWVARDELFKAHIRWATENQGDPERVRKVMRFLAHMYDKFVHGAYITSMELYDPRTNSFMMRGHYAPEKREVYKRAVASKLHEVVTALFCMAQLQQMTTLAGDIGRAGLELHASGELS